MATKKKKVVKKKTSAQKRSAKKTVRKVSRVRSAQTVATNNVLRQDDAVSVQNTVTFPTSKKQVSKGLAIGGLLVNVLIIPGLGTVIVGNFAEGILQLILSLVALVFFMMTQQMVLSLVILIIALVWSIYSTISVMNSAK